MYRYRKGEYVRDSTKGSSMITPMTYKRDVLVQVWVESRRLATLLEWLEGTGETVRFRSEIVRFTLDIALDNLIRDGVVEMVELAEEARNTLHNRFGAFSNPGGRGSKNAYHNLTLDNRRVEEGSIPQRRTIHDTGSPSSEEASSDIDWEEIQKRIKEEEEKEAREQLGKSMERIREAGQIDESNMSEEGGVITPMGKGSSVVYQEDMDAFEKRDEDRKEAEEDDKMEKVLDKDEDRLKEELYLLEEEENEELRRQNGGGEGVREGEEGAGNDLGSDSQ